MPHTLNLSALWILFAILLLSAAASAEDSVAPNSPAPTLAGAWSGTWTDSRKAYSNSGGDFTCLAVEKSTGVWLATFNVGKQKTFKVELTGKPADAASSSTCPSASAPFTACINSKAP